MPTVLNKYKDVIPHGSIYIGRPGKWGNPFPLSDFASREECVQAYREWLEGQPVLIEEVKRELAGANLVCFCAPKLCHGDVLLEIANAK